ncbi:U-box domain-containing protein 25 [Solanum stenotomum]|uniref:U-box domain-containing protein 25 n=1 Tax=Solanum stenotomum TaxID=172797 RepID=UPI0020D1B126|nr:U-box domain-containing protein 25 [Solanum stenotomum]
MKTQHQHPKLKTSFSCGFFRRCTQSVLSPTTTTPPTLPIPLSDQTSSPFPAPAPATAPASSSESSSSSNTNSQSFTQWRFPLPSSPPISHTNIYPRETMQITKIAPPVLYTNLEELFHVAELQLTSCTDLDKVKAMYLLEHSLVPNPVAAVDGGGNSVACPVTVLRGVVGCLKDRRVAKSASKVLLALCLSENNRHVAVEVGAVGVVVDSLSDLDVAAAERSLAALELLCTVAEGAEEVRAHALAVPMMVEVMGRMDGSRGKEYAISVLAVIYGGACDGAPLAAPPEEVARAVMLALQGDCSARGRRKGAQLLKILQNHGRPDPTRDEEEPEPEPRVV